MIDSAARSASLPSHQHARTLSDALRSADTVAWTYDYVAGTFDFRGDTRIIAANLPLRPTIEQMRHLFQAGEAERMLTAMQAVEYIEVGAAGGEISCLVHTCDHRLMYIKGRKMAVGRAMGTLIELTRDLSTSVGADQHMESGLGLKDAHRDPLTGLHNRAGFLQAARSFLSEEGEFDLVVADLNRFRRLNEALGHARADMVLAILSQRMREMFSENALMARLGEDEFAVLTRRGFPRVSDRMRSALERSITVAGFDIHPTFSMGAVSVEGGKHALDSGELLRRAEIAVDAAQSKGIGGVASYRRTLESDGLTRLALEAELRKAFVSGEVSAYYQPIVDLRKGRITGFEALARWVHPKRGLIPPDQFLSVACDMGLMPDLGLIMMTQTADTLRRWFNNYNLPENFFISVNLSAPEVERPQLIEDVTRLIRDAGLPPKALKLEVTESDVMNDPDLSARILTALRDGGAGIALDDFGTGFSSLSYLAKLPFDTIKIDRSFVMTMEHEGSSEKIVRSILNLSRDLGLNVVAEGVEDMALADRLLAMGCDMGQGYGFAKALPLDQAEAFLENFLRNAVALT